MKTYAGLDVSLKEISICVISQEGKVVARGSTVCDPQAITSWLDARALRPELLVHETGQLLIWLQRGLAAQGLSAACIDARKAHKSLSARPNKSDAADAKGLAHLARTGWFTQVDVRSEDADRLGMRQAAATAHRQSPPNRLAAQCWTNPTVCGPAAACGVGARRRGHSLRCANGSRFRARP